MDKIKRSGQHYAKLKTSKRLQRIFHLIIDGEWYTTLEIQDGARVCAVGSAMEVV